MDSTLMPVWVHETVFDLFTYYCGGLEILEAGIIKLLQGSSSGLTDSQIELRLYAHPESLVFTALRNLMCLGWVYMDNKSRYHIVSKEYASVGKNICPLDNQRFKTVRGMMVHTKKIHKI